MKNVISDIKTLWYFCETNIVILKTLIVYINNRTTTYSNCDNCNLDILFIL